MWREMFERQVNKVMKKIKINHIGFYTDGSFGIVFDDGGFYWGSSVSFSFSGPNEMYDFEVVNNDFKLRK